MKIGDTILVAGYSDDLYIRKITGIEGTTVKYSRTHKTTGYTVNIFTEHCANVTVVSGAESDKFDALLEKVKTHFLMLHAKHQRGVLDSHGVGCYGSYRTMLRWMGYEYKVIPPEPTTPVYGFVKVEEND